MKKSNTGSDMAADIYDPDGTLENLARYVITIDRYRVAIYDRSTHTRREIYTNVSGNTIFIAPGEDALGAVVGKHPMETPI